MKAHLEHLQVDQNKSASRHVQWVHACVRLAVGLPSYIVGYRNGWAGHGDRVMAGDDGGWARTVTMMLMLINDVVDKHDKIAGLGPHTRHTGVCSRIYTNL